MPASEHTPPGMHGGCTTYRAILVAAAAAFAGNSHTSNSGGFCCSLCRQLTHQANLVAAAAAFAGNSHTSNSGGFCCSLCRQLTSMAQAWNSLCLLARSDFRRMPYLPNWDSEMAPVCTQGTAVTQMQGASL